MQRAQLRPFCVDLSILSTEDQEQIDEIIKDKDVGILINNAGVSYPFVQYFHEVDQKYG